jgi:hypothetical protein
MARTPGSKNGISHTPGYTAVGQLAKERSAIDYRRDKRFSQKVDYKSYDTALLQRLAERRKNSVSSNAATINAAIQKSKDRLAENRAALAKQQAQALAKAKLQRMAEKQKVKASEEGKSNDWQRQAAKEQAYTEMAQKLREGKSKGYMIKNGMNRYLVKANKKRKKSKSRRGNQNGKKS